MKKQKLLFDLLALFAGAVLPFAFAPFHCYLLAEISLAVLLVVWFAEENTKCIFWRGLLFGTAFFLRGAYWVYISIHNYGNAPIILAMLVLALFVLFFALYPALQGYLIQKIYPQNSWQKFVLAFPASWVIFEWVRGVLFSGFPWLFLGYSHIDAPLRGFAPILGVYGVSFFVAVTAGVIAFTYFNYKKALTVSVLIITVVAVWVSGYFLAKINWTKKNSDAITVSLIQGNIAQEEKWDEHALLPIMNVYAYLTAKNFSSKIIVWPEAAIPTYPENIKNYLRFISFAAKLRATTIVSGIPLHDKKTEQVYNGILAFGASDGLYYKRHLVPFGEYLPLKFILSWLHQYFTIPMSGFSSGSNKQADIFAGKVLIAPFVCYEIAYDSLVLDYMPRAQLLITVCDDSWFGRSVASEQHLEIARMRSLEVGRYQLLSTNTGITAIIDEHGKIVARLPIFEQAVLTDKVYAFTGNTPWVKLGHYLLLPLMFLGLLITKTRGSH